MRISKNNQCKPVQIYNSRYTHSLTENLLNRIRIGRQYLQQTLCFAGSFDEQVCAENTFPEHVPIHEHLFVSVNVYLVFTSSFRRTKKFFHTTKTSLVSRIVGYFPQEVLSPLFYQVQIDKL